MDDSLSQPSVYQRTTDMGLPAFFSPYFLVAKKLSGRLLLSLPNYEVWISPFARGAPEEATHAGRDSAREPWSSYRISRNRENTDRWKVIGNAEPHLYGLPPPFPKSDSNVEGRRDPNEWQWPYMVIETTLTAQMSSFFLCNCVAAPPCSRLLCSLGVCVPHADDSWPCVSNNKKEKAQDFHHILVLCPRGKNTRTLSTILKLAYM